MHAGKVTLTTPTGLPARRVRLFGRDQDAVNIRELLATSPGRLVTIVGPGGCGKTSLALELAHQAVPGFADEGYWLALDGVREPSGVPAALTAAIGAEGETAGSAEAAVRFLRARQALLILDNCEHLLAGVSPLVDRLLSGCPDLRILATSRAPLTVRGEQVYLLPPLAVPTGERLSHEEALEQSPAVSLFLERSRAAGRGTAPERDRLRAIGRICSRLDGLPLAIELAAAQTLAFSPEQIADHLDHRLPLPVRTALAGPERHQTMDRAIDWSCELLSVANQRLLISCSVFSHSWTLPALEAVVPDHPDVAGGLARLIEHSLVIAVDAEGERRYRLLAPIRDYALARIADADAAELRARHAEYYGRAARALTRRPWDQQFQPGEMGQIALDHDNYLAVLAHGYAAGDERLISSMLSSLLIFWRLSGRLHLARERFRAFVAMSPANPLNAAVAHFGLANFEQLLGRHAIAAEHATKALELYRAAGYAGGEILTVGLQAVMAGEVGDYDEARRLYREGTAIAGPSPAGQWAVSLALTGLGDVEYWAGNLDESDRLLREGLAAMDAPPTWYGGLARIRLGSIARRRGRFEESLMDGREGLSLAARLGGAPEVAHGLEELAASEHCLGNAARAASMLGAASALRETTTTPAAKADHEETSRLTLEVRGALSEGAFTRAWVEGRGWSRRQAVDFALDPGRAPSSPLQPLGALTAREVEVAQLVAKGMTNAQIADRLVISPATARTHVERIRSKLGVRSRVSIARVLVDAAPDR
jgi:non-specific serine/threonine protein kinase